ncbi:hypothetical protein [Halorussus sp. MSC15.2]|uniref:hypothetical protein n=1 Tax=Halorussus sp. MSC15.2 TaxID=2283638 RepID=UPI0013CF5449|nr:hypothetical protein [Halorussus sp. MSC15.2]NEU56255.1 hypothetical protein [Halorussus sp. MSC15.2]
MGVLEIHFHDSEFRLSLNPGTDRERTLSLGSRGDSGSSTRGGTSGRPAIASKLRSFGVLALVVGAGVAYNRIQSRRAREAAAERDSGRRFPRIRSR